MPGAAIPAIPNEITAGALPVFSTVMSRLTPSGGGNSATVGLAHETVTLALGKNGRNLFAIRSPPYFDPTARDREECP
jgi:hypothetical protein